MAYEYNATVLRVVDGDTVDVEVDLGFHIFIQMKLRLIGVNAPELKEDAGKVARDALTVLLPFGKQVTINTVRDRQEKYGRYLATIHTSGLSESVNDWLVDKGYAVRYMI